MHTHTQADECAGAMPSLVDRLCQVWFVLMIITGVILFRIGTALVQAVKPITGQSNAEASHSCTVWGCASIPPLHNRTSPTRNARARAPTRTPTLFARALSTPCRAIAHGQPCASRVLARGMSISLAVATATLVCCGWRRNAAVCSCCFRTKGSNCLSCRLQPEPRTPSQQAHLQSLACHLREGSI